MQLNRHRCNLFTIGPIRDGRTKGHLQIEKRAGPEGRGDFERTARHAEERTSGNAQADPNTREPSSGVERGKPQKAALP